MNTCVQKCKNAIAACSWQLFFEKKKVWKQLKDPSKKIELLHLVKWRFLQEVGEHIPDNRKQYQKTAV